MTKLLIHIGLILFVSFHPLHVSVTNLDYQPDRKRCLMAIKVFSDDFTDVIRQREGQKVFSDRDTLSLKDNAVLRPYLKENVQIRIDGKLYQIDNWRLDSVCNNFEASWLYYSLDYAGGFDELSIRNSLFFEVFPDQKNLIIIGKGSEEKAFQINKRKPVVTVRF